MLKLGAVQAILTPAHRSDCQKFRSVENDRRSMIWRQGLNIAFQIRRLDIKSSHGQRSLYDEPMPGRLERSRLPRSAGRRERAARLILNIVVLNLKIIQAPNAD